MTYRTTPLIEDWGRFQLVVGGVDVTIYRNQITEIINVQWAEPFSDISLEVKFPGITMLEALPSWLSDYADVELFKINPDGSKNNNAKFEGFFINEDDRATETETGLTIQFLGALFQHDLRIKKPELVKLNPGQADLNSRIMNELSPTYHPQSRTGPVSVSGPAGVQYTQQGAWEDLLTGHIQDILSIGTSSGYPAPGEDIAGIALNAAGTGYLLIGTRGSVLPFGDARYVGSMLGIPLNEPSSCMVVHPALNGYWFAAKDGGVFSFNVPFYGSLGGAGNPYDIVGIETTVTGNGYWLVDTVGEVFYFGAASFHGSVPALVAGDKVVDIIRSHAGSGYLLVSQKGYVYAYGDAVDSGGASASGKTFVAGSRCTTGGYWLLASDGTAYAYGGAVIYGANPSPTSSATDIVGTSSGLGYIVVGSDGGIFVHGDAPFFGSVPGGGGNFSQWTLLMDPGRMPKTRVKNVWDLHWTVSVGSEGIFPELSRDLRLAKKALYGEGIDLEGCRWRNTRYPNLRPDTSPVFGGTTISEGSSGAQVVIAERELAERWSAAVAQDGVFTSKDANEIRRFQKQAGLTITGTINSQTWAALFQVGSNGGDLLGAFFSPLSQDSRVEQFLYNSMGAKIGNNPLFNPAIMKVEGYDNYGAKVTKIEGILSSDTRRQREDPAGYFGTIRLKADPEEGSRWDIEEGQNIVLQYHRGVDRRFHIAHVEWDLPSLTVTLTIDTKNRDYLTLAALMSRDREQTSNPTSKVKYRNTKSDTIVDTQAVWDCEAGAGVIPRHAIGSGVWNVLRIPAGEAGNVSRSEFYVDTPARFSVGVFDRPITPNQVRPGWSTTGNPLDEFFWDDFTDATGLVISWGGFEQAAGFYPRRESDGTALTGVMVDDAEWYFESQQSPWLWVALWCESPGVNYIRGKLFSSVS